jgi:hypothetical protein
MSHRKQVFVQCMSSKKRKNSTKAGGSSRKGKKKEKKQKKRDAVDELLYAHVQHVGDGLTYCSCRDLLNARRPMIACVHCDEKYHLKCVGEKKSDISTLDAH